MRRGRAPSRELSGSGGPQWDDPNWPAARDSFFFLLYAAWVRSRAERPSVS